MHARVGTCLPLGGVVHEVEPLHHGLKRLRGGHHPVRMMMHVGVSSIPPSISRSVQRQNPHAHPPTRKHGLTEGGTHSPGCRWLETAAPGRAPGARDAARRHCQRHCCDRPPLSPHRRTPSLCLSALSYSGRRLCVYVVAELSAQSGGGRGGSPRRPASSSRSTAALFLLFDWTCCRVGWLDRPVSLLCVAFGLRRARVCRGGSNRISEGRCCSRCQRAASE